MNERLRYRFGEFGDVTDKNMSCGEAPPGRASVALGKAPNCCWLLVLAELQPTLPVSLWTARQPINPFPLLSFKSLKEIYSIGTYFFKKCGVNPLRGSFVAFQVVNIRRKQSRKCFFLCWHLFTWSLWIPPIFAMHWYSAICFLEVICYSHREAGMPVEHFLNS